MGLPKRLTEMQMRFAEFLVFGGPDGPMTKSEAAAAAGTVRTMQGMKDHRSRTRRTIHSLQNILVS